jgi:hypothetical protein
VNLRQFFERYGVALGVVLALTLVIAVLPGNASQRTVDAGLGGLDSGTSAQSGRSGKGGLSASTDASSGDLATASSGTDAGSAGSGTATDAGNGGTSNGGTDGASQTAASGGPHFVTSGPHCRPDGRQSGVSAYMPPCVDWKAGTDNGGSTFRGVTKDKVVVVRYLPQLDPGTQAILQSAGLADDQATIKRVYTVLFHYWNLHAETYGREVQFVDLPASGPNVSDEAMKADALKIATQIKPFAVIEGNPAAPLSTVLIRELAQRGVLCMCSTTLSVAYYNELPPLIFSSLPTMDEYAANTAEYIKKKLAGKNAQFAGDELNPTQGYKNKPRKFGLIYLEGARGKVDPEGARARDAFVREFQSRGISFDVEIGYIYDPGRNQQDVTNLISTLKQKGITTVVPVWDPLYPILITKEATNQQYFPEWFIVGTGLSDTTTAGRLYDQAQWKHAFGISPLWVTWATVAKSPGYREYHNGDPSAPPGAEGVLINVYRARIATLFRGIHMAGPNLTNETFVKGQFAFPPTGGKPALPLVFLTRQLPTEIKDFMEVWWNPTLSGPDERGKQQPGMMMKANGGTRYQLGKWTADPSRAFDSNGAVTVTDNPAGGGDPPHEQDGHKHSATQRCLSCT